MDESTPSSRYEDARRLHDAAREALAVAKRELKDREAELIEWLSEHGLKSVRTNTSTLTIVEDHYVSIREGCREELVDRLQRSRYFTGLVTRSVSMQALRGLLNEGTELPPCTEDLVNVYPVYKISARKKASRSTKTTNQTKDEIQ